MKLIIFLALIAAPFGLMAQNKTEIFKQLSSIFQKAEGIEYVYKNSLGEQDKSIVGVQRFLENEIFVTWKNNNKINKISCQSPDWKQVGDISINKLNDKLGVLRLMVGKGSNVKYTVDGENREASLSISFYFKLKDKEKVGQLIDKLGRELYGDDFDE